MKYKTIKELYEAARAGKIDETKLEIVLDNDDTTFYLGPAKDEEGNDIDNEIEIAEANGYGDIDKLYALLFPKATVGWC